MPNPNDYNSSDEYKDAVAVYIAQTNDLSVARARQGLETLIARGLVVFPEFKRAA